MRPYCVPLCLLLVLVACGQQPSEPPPYRYDAPERATVLDNDEGVGFSRQDPAPLGVRVRVPNFEFRILGYVLPADVYVAGISPEGSQYIAVEIEATCKQDECNFSPNNFTLVGSQGIPIESRRPSGDFGPILEDTEFFEDVVISGYLLFEIPVNEDIDAISLRWEPLVGAEAWLSLEEKSINASNSDLTPVAATATETAVTELATLVPSCDCTGDLYDCSSFDDPLAAQSCYDYCFQETDTDIHLLDSDLNGVVCELTWPEWIITASPGATGPDETATYDAFLSELVRYYLERELTLETAEETKTVFDEVFGWYIEGRVSGDDPSWRNDITLLYENFEEIADIHNDIVPAAGFEDIHARTQRALEACLEGWGRLMDGVYNDDQDLYQSGVPYISECNEGWADANQDFLKTFEDIGVPTPTGD